MAELGAVASTSPTRFGRSALSWPSCAVRPPTGRRACRAGSVVHDRVGSELHRVAFCSCCAGGDALTADTRSKRHNTARDARLRGHLHDFSARPQPSLHHQTALRKQRRLYAAPINSLSMSCWREGLHQTTNPSELFVISEGVGLVISEGVELVISEGVGLVKGHVRFVAAGSPSTGAAWMPSPLLPMAPADRYALPSPQRAGVGPRFELAGPPGLISLNHANGSGSCPGPQPSVPIADNTAAIRCFATVGF